MTLHRAKLSGPSSVLLAGLGLVTMMALTEALADTRTTEDYIAIVVEAEDHSVKDERWVLTEPATPAQDDDPDPNHSADAIGQAYLELLPDMRVTHEDEFGPPTAIWNQPGTGPRAEYPLYFPEAGRYYVHVRAFSTGTEDNGLHVGLNGDFPDSGARLQFCTAGKGWSWSSRQRDSGGVGPCGVRKTIWVTVPDVGMHTFMISAREDGFEIDRIMLMKDLSDNSRICEPDGADGIKCVNGSLENVDDVVDIAVSLERYGSESSELPIDATVDFTAVVSNLDGYDTASDVVLSVETGTTWQVLNLDEGCSQADGTITCSLGTVPPSGPEGEQSFDFSLMPMQSGSLAIEAEVHTNSIDGSPGNDTAGLTLTVVDEDSLSNLTTVIAESASAWVTGSESTLSYTVTNHGPAVAARVEAMISLPSGVTVTRAPQSCDVSGSVVCSWVQLAVDESRTIELGVTPARAGLYSVSLLAEADNQDAGAAELAADSVIVTVTTPDSSDSTGSIGLWLLSLLAMSLLTHALGGQRQAC